MRIVLTFLAILALALPAMADQLPSNTNAHQMKATGNNNASGYYYQHNQSTLYTPAGKTTYNPDTDYYEGVSNSDPNQQGDVRFKYDAGPPETMSKEVYNGNEWVDDGSGEWGETNWDTHTLSYGLGNNNKWDNELLPALEEDGGQTFTKGGQTLHVEMTDEDTLWIDLNGDGIEDCNEIFFPSQDGYTWTNGEGTTAHFRSTSIDGLFALTLREYGQTSGGSPIVSSWIVNI